MVVKWTAIYLRVSTDVQTVEQQREPVLQAAGDVRPDQRYEDIMTGQTFARPAMKKLIEAIKADKIKDLWVWKLDRLGRNAREINKFCILCEEHDVIVHILTPQIDTSTTYGKMFVSQSAFFAELETEQLSERVRLKLDYKRKTHRWKMHGTPKNCVSDKVAAAAKAVLSLHKSGMTLIDISRNQKLNPKSIRKIIQAGDAGVMTRKEYAKLHPGWQKEQQTIPDGLTVEEFDKQQAASREKRRKRTFGKGNVGL